MALFSHRENALAQYGYSQDGQRDKPQIVFGLLRAADGCPVAVEVFDRNTADPILDEDGTAMTVQITRLEHDADALRQHAARTAAAPVARRLLALALVLEGQGRADAANSCGMDRQTLRDWVIRYNEHGIAGLSDLPKRGGAAPKLSVEEKAVLAEWVQQGPDLAEDGVVRWRLRDLRDRIGNG
jgi:transposase